MRTIVGSKLKYLIGVSLRYRIMFIAAAIALAVVAYSKMSSTPTNLIPEFGGTLVEIQTEALGLSAVEVESLISAPLEADLLNGLPWVESIRSDSIASLATSYLRFEPGTNVLVARQMVQERLTQAAGLPNVSKPPVMLQPTSSTSRILQVGMKSKDVSLIQMSVLARWNIRPLLMGIPGVANVSIWGLRNRQLQVLVDPDRLRAQGVKLQDIISTAGNSLWYSPLSFLEAHSPGTGGFIDGPNQRLGVRHVLPIVSAEGLANVVIDGSKKKLGDVAQVVEDHQPLVGDAFVDGETGLILVVEKFPWTSTLEVTRNVENALKTIQPGLTGIELNTKMFRPASFIERSVGNLKMAVLVGGVLILIGLFVFFYDLRVAVVSAVAIVSSLLLAWFVLYLRGVTVDSLVFVGLAIAIGAIVDDAIVDVQNIRHRLTQKQAQGMTAWNLVLEAVSSIRSSMIYATLMLLLLMFPLFIMDGVFGAYMKTAAASYSLALIASLLVAMFLTPALSLLLLVKQTGEARGSTLGRSLAMWFTGIASRFARATGSSYVITGISIVVLILVMTVVTYPGLHSEAVLPKFHETDLLIRWDTKAGTSLPEMSRVTKRVIKDLQAVPGIVNVGGHVGRASNSDQVVGANSGSLWVSIDPKAKYNETLDAIDKVLLNYPGVEYDTSTYAEARIEHANLLEEDKVLVRVYGADTNVLEKEGHKLKDLLSGIQGVEEIEVAAIPMEATIEIRVDLARARQHGIKPGDVRRAGAAMLSGIEVGSLFEDKKVFDVIVWGVPEIRGSVTAVKNLLLQSPTGAFVRLGEIADVSVVSQPAVIKREAVGRYVDVHIDVAPNKARAVGKEVEKRLKGHTYPSEYHAKVIGVDAKAGGVKLDVLGAILIAALGIFLLLQAALRSWRLAGLVLLTLPVALLGGFVLILVTGAEYNFGAFIGLITLAGFALRAATSLITHYQHLERVEGVAFGFDLVSRGILERATPVLASAIVIGLAMLPFLLFRSQAGLEIVGPMAGVIVAGLFTTVVFVLLVLPAMYMAFGSNSTSEEDFEELGEHELYA